MSLDSACLNSLLWLDVDRTGAHEVLSLTAPDSAQRWEFFKELINEVERLPLLDKEEKKRMKAAKNRRKEILKEVRSWFMFGRN